MADVVESAMDAIITFGATGGYDVQRGGQRMFACTSEKAIGHTIGESSHPRFGRSI